MTKHKRVYQPFEKVIVTKELNPRIGYVVANKDGNTGVYGKGQWQVRIAYNMEDAQEGVNKLINYNYVLPYSQDLWEACERLEKKRLELGELYMQLRKGVIPKELQPLVQGSFFAIEMPVTRK